MATKKKAAKKNAPKKKAGKGKNKKAFLEFTITTALAGRRIDSHDANFNPSTNIGNVRLNFSDGPPTELKNLTTATFTCLLEILRSQNKALSNGYIIAGF